MKPSLLITLLLVFSETIASGQSNCASTFAKTIGSALTNERGNSIAIDNVNMVIYVAGSVNDSTLLLQVNTEGDILWSRAFDALQGEPERASTIIMDSEGMIVISGLTNLNEGGKVYLLKYDPVSDLILWANEYKSHSNNYTFTLIEKGPGENYILSNNPFSPQDAEVLEIDRATGLVNETFSKHYHYGSAQSLLEIVRHGVNLYATGRFTDGTGLANMRTVLLRMDPNNGFTSWVRLGHRPGDVNARLYGSDLVIDQEKIYSTSHGDPDGIDATDDQMFIQKTSLEGDVEWIKHYQLPGTADVTDEIIATGDGFVILTRNRGPSDIHLFKINHEGDVLWARKYDFAENDNTYFLGGSGNELVMMDDALYFTAYAEEDGRRDLILVKTDLEGQLADDCDIVTAIDIAVTPVNDAEYYPISADIFTFVPEVIALEVSPSVTSLQTENTCASNSSETEIEESICMGDVYEGYNQAGTYVDTFPLPNGCDSIRILYLRLLNCDPLVVYDLNACAANMVTGTNMVYTEFVPHFPDVSTCAAVSAGYLFRSSPQENKHSCTPGLNSTPAMCVSALSGCTYQPENSASVIIEVTLTPEPSSIFQFTALQFYEKAPTTYDWIDGDSGPNNYPTLFGIRILKNGTEVYSNPAVLTATTWNLKEFDFTDDSLFEIEVPSLFRIELLPYCPVGNGAAVSAWDLEDIVVLGGCVRLPGADPLITGNVFTSKGIPVPDVEIHISDEPAFSVYEAEDVNALGAYQIANLQPGGSHFLKAHHNHDFLQGVSTMDILAIQKHLLGIKPFSSLDQYVAADINHDGRVNISDLIILRKSLLGYTPYFPQNTSWRFGIWPQSLESTDPASLKEVATIESLQSGPTIIDFLGIKIGDLNGNVLLNATNDPIVRRNPSFELAIENVEMKRGIPFTIEIKATEDAEIEGLQLGLQLDAINLVDVQGIALSIADEHISFLDNGILRLSWTSDHSMKVKDGDVLFTLTLTPEHDASLSDAIRVANEALTCELYTSDETLPITLRHDPFKDVNLGGGIGYFTIVPNPFNTSAILTFQVLSDADVLLDIYDPSGKEVLVHQANYKAGEHTLTITAEDLKHARGMLICRLVSEGEVEVRKVVRL